MLNEDLQIPAPAEGSYSEAYWERSTTGQQPNTTGAEGSRTGSSGNDTTPLTALECFDKRSVKILTGNLMLCSAVLLLTRCAAAISLLTCLVFILINLLTVLVSNDLFRSVAKCSMLSLWSLNRLIGRWCGVYHCLAYRDLELLAHHRLGMESMAQTRLND